MALDKRYDPKLVEKDKYDRWKKAGYFTAGDKTKTPFSMVIPPPNVTGKLHLGHAWDTTIQDILARYKRAQGFDVLWLPGMDHAGIATQAKVEAKLRKKGLSRFDLGREAFLKEAWAWKDEYAHNIHNQWAMLGLSLDYTRERFTLDEGLNEAVRKVFVDLYNKGLIYQGERIINWDPQQMTALSNIEVIHSDDEGDFFYFRYRVVGSKDVLVVATTRPETMFGDVCLVVNPKDERFKKYVGKHVINPANHQEIPVITDEYVDIAFGTGVMKCTPAHDPNDFLLGEKYHLERPVCLNKDATMNELAGKYQGQDRFVCRKNLVKAIDAEGNLEKIEHIVHPVGHSERSGAVVEPYLSKQWFVKMRPLAESALKGQEGDDQVTFYPERFDKTFRQWMENAEDWCISRQLWWGHQIPAYYHKVTGDVVVSVNPPKDIENYTQDEDVLDTWFSSALWPFSTLGWPHKTKDLERYFPLDAMVTGYDIIFFWVSRMIFQSREFTGQRPFKDVLIHGLIRDSQGRKMSKSLGNGVDPNDVIDAYGADALRYFLTTNSTPGQDARYMEEKIASSANYLNKIWNAARYIEGVLPEDFKPETIAIEKLNPLDKFIMARLHETIDQVTTNMDKYEFGMASSFLYNFVYDDFCSWYLEMSKVTLQGDDEDAKKTTHQVLYTCLKAILGMIGPFTPFIAEELYLHLPAHGESLMLEAFPKASSLYQDKAAIEEVSLVFDLIRSVRSYKVDNQLAPNQAVTLYFVTHEKKKLEKYLPYLSRFTFAKEIVIQDSHKGIESHNVVLFPGVEMIIVDATDKATVIAKLDAEIKVLESEVARGQGMLSNPNFVNKAPEAKIALEKDKLAKNLEQLATVKAKRAKL